MLWDDSPPGWKGEILLLRNAAQSSKWPWSALIFLFFFSSSPHLVCIARLSDGPVLGSFLLFLRSLLLRLLFLFAEVLAISSI